MLNRRAVLGATAHAPVVPTLATNDEDPRRVFEDAEITRLAREDRIRFAKALIDPPGTNERLARAAKRHADLIALR